MRISVTFLRTDLTDVGRQYFDAAAALIAARSEVGVVSAGMGMFFVDEDPPADAIGIRWNSANVADADVFDLLPTVTSDSGSLLDNVAAIRNSTDELGAARVVITLPALPPGATSFILQRSLDGASWATIRTGLAGSAVFTDTGLQAGTTYHYRRGAVNGSGTTYGVAQQISTSA